MSLKILASLIILIAVVAHAVPKRVNSSHRGKQGKRILGQRAESQLRPQKASG